MEAVPTMSKPITAARLAAALLIVAGLSACVSRGTVDLGHHGSSSSNAGVKIYGTDNVPFEYEEIAFHFRAYQSSNVGAATAHFCREVKQLDADAILNFRISPSPWRDDLRVEGVAVRIKRP